MCLCDQGVAESESRRAADAAEGKYKESFNMQVSADDKDLMAEHVVSTRTHTCIHARTHTGHAVAHSAFWPGG